AEISAKIEEIVLYGYEAFGDADAGRQIGEESPRESDAAVGLIDGPIGLNAQIILAPPFAGAETRHAGIPRARVNLVQLHHAPAPFPSSPHDNELSESRGSYTLPRPSLRSGRDPGS